MPNSIPNASNITRQTLPNGIVVLTYENPDVQSVVIKGSFSAGATYEHPHQHGVAAITAEALSRGTTARAFDDLHETLEGAGMSLDFSGGRFMTSFDGKALAEDLPLLLDLLSDMLRNPTFPEAHLELIKGEIITGLTYNQQDTRYRASQTFSELAYPKDHILHRNPLGTIESVQGITREDVVAFHQNQYGAGKMVIAIVGNINTAAAIKAVEKNLGDWENPHQQTDFHQPSIPSSNGINFQAVNLAGKTQSDLVLGVVGPSRMAADYQAARMANNILGVFGMMGRLGASVREEKGLAYYSYSSLDGGLSQGAWRAIAGVSPKDAKLAVQSIRAEIEQMINTPVSADDLADNQANLTARLPLLLESNSGVANNLLSMERYDLGLDYLQNYGEMINGITIEDVQTAMQTYWNPASFNLAIAGPELAESII